LSAASDADSRSVARFTTALVGPGGIGPRPRRRWTIRAWEG